MRTPEQCHQLPTLSSCVWHQRRLAERLLYTVVAARLMLLADERRFIGWTLQESEALVAALRAAEPDRAAAIEAVASAWDVDPRELTLARVAREAPEPWATIFDDHHRCLTELTFEIAAAVQDNRRLAAGRSRARRGPTVGPMPGIALPPPQRLAMADAATNEQLEELAYEAAMAVFDEALPDGLVSSLG